MKPMDGVAGLLLLASACAAPPSDAFAAVAALAAERGRLEVRRIAPDDTEALAAVDALLEGGLEEQEAVGVAFLASRELQARLAELDVARGDFALYVAGANPTLSMELLFPSGGTSVELALVQDLVSLTRAPQRRRIASAQLEAAVLRTSEGLLELAARVRTLHLDVRAAEQLLELRRTSMEAFAASHELAQRLHDAGNVTELFVLREAAQAQEARQEVAVAERRLALARERLNSALGLWGTRTAWTVPARLAELPGSDPALDEVERTAVAASLDLAARRHALEAAAERSGLAQAQAWLAELELGPRAEREDGAWDWGAELEVPLPLWDQGAGRKLRAAAELQRDAERLRSRAVELRAAVRAAASEVLALGAEVRHLRDVLLPLRGAVTRETLLHYNAMQLGAFELLLARREEVRVGARYVETLHAYWRARARLDLLVAGGPVVGQPADGLTMSSDADEAASLEGGH